FLSFPTRRSSDLGRGGKDHDLSRLTQLRQISQARRAEIVLRPGNPLDRVNQGRELGAGGETLEADLPGFRTGTNCDGGDVVDPIGAGAAGVTAGINDVKRYLLRRRVFE